LQKKVAPSCVGSGKKSNAGKCGQLVGNNPNAVGAGNEPPRKKHKRSGEVTKKKS